jgi:hypothetical protein
MWMQPSENPQGLGTLYVSNLLKGKEKVEEPEINGGKLSRRAKFRNQSGEIV